jgi:P-type Ca2+ transporter type 2C
MIGGQVLIMFVGGLAFNVVPQTGVQWAVAIIMGAVSIPIGVIIRMIPDELIAKCLPYNWQMRFAPDSVKDPEKGDGQKTRDGPENLAFINKIKGGRIRHVRSGLHKLKEAGKKGGLDGNVMASLGAMR